MIGSFITSRTWLAQFILLAWLLAPGATAQPNQSADRLAVNNVLDDFHAAAAAGDWPRYFALWSDDGVFIGTDASERWPKVEFMAYAEGSSGWIYEARSRNINFTPDGNTAWFDEILDSASYGTSRGTGVLIRGEDGWEDGWKVSQYHLTFPIPNALVRDITDSIKAWEAAQ